MAVRSTMAQLITRTRFMIQDVAGASQFFADQDLQDSLDEVREDIRYEALQIAPTVLNAASTGNQAEVIFADYYSRYQWWESDVVLQGVNTSTNAAWVVITPTTSDYITGHWTFESNIFTAGTAPGQYPPLFATGKVFDLYLAAADALEFWAASFAGAYDITVDGQSLHRSQLMTAKLNLAAKYRMKAKPKRAKLTRPDVNPEITARRTRLLDSTDPVRGG